MSCIAVWGGVGLSDSLEFFCPIVEIRPPVKFCCSSGLTFPTDKKVRGIQMRRFGSISNTESLKH